MYTSLHRVVLVVVVVAVVVLVASPTFQKNSFLSSSSLIQPTSPSTSPSTSSLSPTTTTFKPPSISPLKLSPRVRSATSFGEMNSHSENMNGIGTIVEFNQQTLSYTVELDAGEMTKDYAPQQVS